MTFQRNTKVGVLVYGYLALPSHRRLHTLSTFLQNAMSSPAYDNCMICLEPITAPATLHACLHTFCIPCFETWSHTFQSYKDVTCPICRGRAQTWHDGQKIRMPWWVETFRKHLFVIRAAFCDQKHDRELYPHNYFYKSTGRSIPTVSSVSENVETFLSYVCKLLEVNRLKRDREEFERLEWIIRTLKGPMLKVCKIMAPFPGWHGEKHHGRPFSCAECEKKGLDACCVRKSACALLRVMNEVEAGFRDVLRPEEMEYLLALGYLYP
jgi:hypothetical protein